MPTRKYMKIIKQPAIAAIGIFSILAILSAPFAQATGTSGGLATINTDPQDFATLTVSNRTVSGETDSAWFSSVNASPGNVISFAIYYHVTGNKAAQNLRVRLTPQSTGVNGTHIFNANVWADNANSVGGQASVFVSPSQSMSYIPGEIFWRANQTVWGSSPLLNGQNGSEIFTNQGLNLGTIQPGWPTQGSVVVRFKIAENPAAQMPTVDLNANPTTIQQGGSSVLSWTSTNATSCTGTSGWAGSKPTSGSETVFPQFNQQIYTIICFNSAGQQVSDSVTINVSQGQLPTVSLSANPSRIQQGGSTVLSWTSTNATSCTASNGWFGTKPVSGSETVFPSVNTSYSIICTNSVGQASAFTFVNVDTYQTQPTLSLVANPNYINSGGSSVLTWNSSNASNCYASGGGWSGSRNLSGSETVWPGYTQTYTMTCSNSSGGSVTSQATVTVSGQQSTPTVTISSNPSVIYSGSSAVLNWYSSNASYCTASGSWSGSKNLSGSETVWPSINSTYYITCYNNNAQAVAQTTVYVNGQNYAVPTVNLTANPQTISNGGSTVLVWSSSNASSCYASNGWTGTKALSGSQAVYPGSNTTYSITCTNNSGQQATDSETVFVNTVLYTPPTTGLSVSCVPSPAAARVNQAITFAAGASGGRAPYTYTWNRDISGSGITRVWTFTTTGTKTARVIVQDADGRTADGLCNVTITPAVVTVAPPPPPPVVVAATPPCNCPTPVQTIQAPTCQTYVSCSDGTSYPVTGGAGATLVFDPSTNSWRQSSQVGGYQNTATPQNGQTENGGSLTAIFAGDESPSRLGFMVIWYFMILLGIGFVALIYSAVRRRD